MSQKIEKGKAYTATHKETKQTVDILGINSELDLVIVGTIPNHIDSLSHYTKLKPAENLSDEQISGRDAQFGLNWDN